MRQTPVSDYLEDISTGLPVDIYGNLSDAIYETVCEFDEEVAQLKAENAKLRELVDELYPLADYGAMDASELDRAHDLMRELGVEVGYE